MKLRFITLCSLLCSLSLLAQSINFNFATTNPPTTLTNIVAALGTGGVGIAAAAGTNVFLSTNASLVTFNGRTDTNIVNSLAAAQAALVRQTNVAVAGVTNAGTMAYSNAVTFVPFMTQTNVAVAGVTNAGTMAYSNAPAFLTLVTNIATSSSSGQTNDAISIAGTGIAIVTNGPTGGKTSYTTSVADPLSLTTLNAGTANLTNMYGLMASGNVTNAAGSRVAYLSDVGGSQTNIAVAGVTNAGTMAYTNTSDFLSAGVHWSGNSQWSGSNNYSGTLVLEGAVRIDDGSLIATNMTARTNESGSSALTTYGQLQVLGDITNTGTIHGNSGQFHAPVTTTSSSSNSPATLEFPTAGWVRSLFNSGLIDYATSNIDNVATNPATLNQVVYDFWQGVIPDTSVRTWASGFITNNGYIGSVCTTNTFTVLNGPVDVNAYIGATTAGSLNNFFLTIHPEIYYSYDRTNWYGDYVANSQAISGNATNLYSWVISFPSIIATNTTGFYVQRRLKVDTASTAGNVPTVYFMIGTNLVSNTNNASHMSFSGPNSALGNAYLANNQTFTGTNTFTVGTRTLSHDGSHTVITNTATLTSSEWTAGSQKEWYNGAATMTIDKTNGVITANGYASTTNAVLAGQLDFARHSTLTNASSAFSLSVNIANVPTTVEDTLVCRVKNTGSTFAVTTDNTTWLNSDHSATHYVTNGHVLSIMVTVQPGQLTNAFYVDCGP